MDEEEDYDDLDVSLDDVVAVGGGGGGGSGSGGGARLPGAARRGPRV